MPVARRWGVAADLAPWLWRSYSQQRVAKRGWLRDQDSNLEPSG